MSSSHGTTASNRHRNRYGKGGRKHHPSNLDLSPVDGREYGGYTEYPQTGGDDIEPDAVTGDKIKDETIGITKFASTLRPVQLVSSLPTLPDDEYPEGSVVFLTTTGVLYRNYGNVWTAAVATTELIGQITTAQIEDAALSIAKFQNALRPVAIVGTLPTLAHSDYPVGALVYYTVDGKLYRNVSNSWTKAVAGGDIEAGSITGDKIQAGTITAGLIAAGAITAEKLSIGSMGSNVLLNPGFEEASTSDPTIPARWVINPSDSYGTYNWVHDGYAGTVISGAYSADIILYNAFSTLAVMTDYLIPVTPGETWYLSSMIWGTTPTAASSVFLRVYTYDADGAFITSTDVAVGSHAAANARTKLEGTWLVPSGTTQVRVVLKCYSPNYGGGASYPHYAVFDDVTFQKVIVSAYIADGAITTNKLYASAITADKIATGTITADKLVANSITAGQIASGAIATDELAANAVTAAKIAANTITANEIAADAITSSELAAGSVTAYEMNVGASSGAVILTNTMFNGTTGWVSDCASGNLFYTQGIISTEYPPGTTYGVLYSASGTQAGFYSEKTFPISAGTDVSVSASVWGVGAARTFYFYFHWYNNAGGYISGTNSSATTGTGAFTYYSGQSTAPAGAQQCRVGIYHYFAGYLGFTDFRVSVAQNLHTTGVRIDSNGVLIVGGRLTVYNPSATVIIDGTSNMFKIIASGSTSVTGGNNTYTTATVKITALGASVTQAPAYLAYISDSTGSGYFKQLGCSGNLYSVIAGGYVTQTAHASTFSYVFNSEAYIGISLRNISGGSLTTYLSQYHVLKEYAM